MQSFCTYIFACWVISHAFSYLLAFSKLRKIAQEHYKSVLLVLIWVSTVCKAHLQMTKFSIGMQRVLSTSKHLTVQGIISYLDYIYHKYWDTLDYIYHKYWDTLNSFLDIWFNYCNETTHITQEAAKQHSWGQKNRQTRLKPTIILKKEWSYEHPTIKFLPLYILDPRVWVKVRFLLKIVM